MAGQRRGRKGAETPPRELQKSEQPGKRATDCQPKGVRMQTRLSSGLAPVFTRWSVVLPLWLAFFVVVGQPARAPAQATPFTYQGQLTDGGAAANGNYDLALGLFATATAGERIGSPQTVSPR